MRVIAGTLRGSTIKVPKGLSTRPTTGRIRETLFNILSNHLDFDGLKVLDLFAGTGALGIESISRGAVECHFVEQAPRSLGVIRENLENLKLSSEARVTKGDATKLGMFDGEKAFDLVFADPPYSKGLGERAAHALFKGSWLAPAGIFVLEEATASFPEKLNGFDPIDVRSFGETTIGLFKLTA